MRKTLWGAVIMLGAATVLSAATLKVPADYPTIAAALAAAADGDTVVLAKGTYFENNLAVNVGITLKGSGATIDGNVAGTVGAGIAITGDNAAVIGVRFQNSNNGTSGANGQVRITGNNATVSKCTFRNGAACILIAGDNALISANRISQQSDDGDFIEVVGHQARILKNTIVNGEGDVIVVGNQATVSGNIISTVEEDGAIRITGDDAIVTSNQCSNLDDHAIYLNGHRAFVSKNTIRNVDNAGIYLNGSDAVVTGNKVYGTCDEGIYVSGANAAVSKNTVMYCLDDEGIYVTGDNALISSNKISCVMSYDAISVRGDGYRIEKNTIADVGDDSIGICVRQTTLGAAGGGVIVGNKLSYVVEYALDLIVYGATIEKNTMTWCGSENQAIVALVGDDNLVLNCTVKDSGHHGFSINGDNNTLRGCKAIGSHKDGFHIVAGSVGTLLEDCDAIDCGGEGLDNQDGAPGATNTSALNCLFKDNHLDIADGGNGIVDTTGTVWTTGGPGTPSEVD